MRHHLCLGLTVCLTILAAATPVRAGDKNQSRQGGDRPRVWDFRRKDDDHARDQRQQSDGWFRDDGRRQYQPYQPAPEPRRWFGGWLRGQTAAEWEATRGHQPPPRSPQPAYPAVPHGYQPYIPSPAPYPVAPAPQPLYAPAPADQFQTNPIAPPVSPTPPAVPLPTVTKPAPATSPRTAPPTAIPVSRPSGPSGGYQRMPVGPAQPVAPVAPAN
jgi:hypothetical protein